MLRTVISISILFTGLHDKSFRYVCDCDMQLAALMVISQQIAFVNLYDEKLDFELRQNDQLRSRILHIYS